MSPESRSRAQVVADAAIEVTAQRGMRGLTHRAVDAAAGLPAGSTSNLARTRAALLRLALDRIAELDAADQAAVAGARDAAQLADRLAALVHEGLTRTRARLVARYEFALEATRRAELREVYDTVGARARGPAAGLLAGLGSRDPGRDAALLIAFLEGVQFDALAGAGGARPVTLEELRANLRLLLGAMLGPRAET